MNQNFSIINNTKKHQVNAFLSFIALFNLKQYNFIENSQDNILDLVLSNFIFTSQHSLKVTKSHDNLVNIDSYHPPLFTDLIIISSKTKRPNTNSKNSILKVYHYKNGNFSALNNALRLVDWANLFQDLDINSALDNLYQELDNQILTFIPLKNITEFKFPTWVSPELKNLILQKKCTHKSLKKKPNNPHLYNTFILLRKLCKQKTYNDYNIYVKNIEKLLTSDPAKFWPFIKNKKKDNQLPSSFYLNDKHSSDGNQIANMFANNFSSVYSQIQLAAPKFSFENCLSSPISKITITRADILEEIKTLKFDSSSGPDNIPPIIVKKCAFTLVTPLLILFNLTLATGQYPKKWKTSYIIPIFKSGDKANIQQYRPIFKLSWIPKLLEAIIYKKTFPTLVTFNHL